MSCGGGSGGGTNTITQNTAPPPQVLQNYQNLTNAAFTQAGQPLQQYTNPLVAGFTPQQTQGFQETQNAQGMATPYINAAAQEFGQATTPFYQSEPAYQSPYTGQVTNALSGLFSQQNAQQQQQVNSNATAQGAFGGDRGAVANALTAQQQNLSEAPTMANVLQGGYQTALGAAEAQGYLGEQGGFGIGSLGTEAQNAALTGASAELSAGGLQQQLEQEQLNIPYEQFQSAQAYPWQVLGELSPIVSGAGSLSGGTGSTTYPGPSLVSQLGGLGISGLGVAGLTGGFGPNGYLTGAGGIIPELTGTGAIYGAGTAAPAAAAILGLDPATASVGDVAAGALAAALKTGGRIGFADGGGIGNADTSASSLPPVPTINLDYLVHPGPLTKGSGPPKAPQGNPDQFRGQTPTQELQMFSGLDKMVGESGIGAGSAFGGRTRTHHDDGGPTPLMQSSLVGLPPQLQNAAQQFQNMPLDQLQNVAARMPPGSPYGAVVQKVLQMRRMSPGNTTNAVSSASGVPIGTGAGQVPQQQGGIGNQQQPGAGGISTLNPPQSQGQSQGQGYAAGGGPIIQDEPDMDPHPVVDHSGPTVVVRYPSEGKALDLGIPSSPGRRTLAAGGAGGTVTPGPATVIGSGASSGQPFFSSVTAPNGIALPQLSMDAFAAPGGPGSMAPTAGGGLGAWANPLPQIGTPGSWPQVAPQTPGIAALESAFGGAGGGAAGPAAVAGPVAGPAPLGSVAIPPTPTQVAEQAMATQYENQSASSGSGTSKSGGRTGLQEGGDADTDSVPGVTVAPNSPFAAGNGFGSPDLGPAAAVVTPAGGIVTPAAPASAPAPTTTPAAPASMTAPPADGGNKYDAYLRAHGETPQDQDTSSTTPSSANVPLPPSLQPMLKRESGGNYQAQNPTSTASGGLQDVDATWREAMHGLGYGDQWAHAKDAPENIQNAANIWLQGKYGNKPWAASDPSRLQRISTSGPADQVVGPRNGIGTATGIGGSTGEPVPAMTGFMTDQGGIGGGSGNPDIARALARIESENAQQPASYAASPWMIPIAIGAGMMSGRSSHPLVNVGEGMMAGVKTAETQAQQVPENQLRQAQAQTARIQNELLPGRMQAMIGNEGRVAAVPSGQSTVSDSMANAPATAAPVGDAAVAVAPASPVGSGVGALGLSVPKNIGQDPQYSQFDQQYAAIDKQISDLSRYAPWDPTKYSENLATIARLRDSYVNTMQHDPRIKVATDWAEVGPKAATAGAEEQARMPYELHPARPGSYMYQGNHVIGATPTVRTITNPETGAKSEEFMAPPLPAGSAPAASQGQQQPAPTVSVPAAGSGTASPDGLGKAWQTALGPGQQIALEDRAKIEQTGREETLKEAQAAQNQQSTLNVLKDNAGKMYTGPGADYVGDFNSVARLVDPSFNDTVAAREMFAKNGGQLVRQATRELSPRAAFQEVRFIQTTLPNQEMSPQGLQGVIGELQGLNDYKMAKATAQSHWEEDHGGVGHVEGFESDWQAHPPVTPYTFIISRMEPQEQQKLFSTWSSTDEGRRMLQKLAAERQYAISNGLTQ